MVESCSFFFFKQKTAYEMRISDWSSDVCSSDLPTGTSPPKSPLLSDPPDLFFVTQIFPHRCILQCYTTSDRKPSLHHIKTWVQKEGHCGRQRRHSGHALRATVNRALIWRGVSSSSTTVTARSATEIPAGLSPSISRVSLPRR